MVENLFLAKWFDSEIQLWMGDQNFAAYERKYVDNYKLRTF